MAIVNLATFEIDSSKAQKEISKLQETMFSLSQKQKTLRDESKALEKAIKDLGDITEENVSEYENLVIAQQSVFKSQQELAKQTSVVRAEYNSLVAVQKTRITTDQKTLSMSEAITKALGTEVKNINSAKASITQLTKLRNQLNPEIEEEANLITQLNTKIDQNNNFIKQNSSALEKQKINVGNYTDSIIEAYKEMDKQKKELEALNEELQIMRDNTEEGTEEWKIFNQQINNNNTQINTLVADMGRAKGEFNDLNDVAGLASGGLGGFIEASSKAGGSGKLIASAGSAAATGIMGMVKASLAFIATPIGAILAAIVAVLLLVKNAMNQNTEATQKITSIFNVFGSVVKQIFKVVEPFGTWLIDGLAKGFEVAGELAEKAMRGLAAAMEFLGMEEAAKSVNSFTDNVKESAKAAYELANAELEMENAQREAQKTMLTYQNEAEKLRQIRDDDMKSMPERIAANDALGVSLQKQMQVEKQLAQTALNVAQLRIKANGETKESLDALAEAQTNLIDIEERITGQMSEQLTNRNALLKEQAEKAEEIRQKAYENALKRMQDELKLFQEQQGFKSKTLEEEFKLFEETSKRETDILKLQLKNRAISQTEYNAEMQRLQNEQGLKLAEIAIENAEIELKAYKELNNDKYLENQRLNDDLFAQENKRRADILAADQAFAELQLEQGIINKTEYNAKMLELESEFNENKKALNDNFETTRREDEAKQRELDKEAKILNTASDAWAQFDAEQLIADEQRQENLINLDQQRADGLISEENYLKAKTNIEKEYEVISADIEKRRNDFKLNLASQTLSNLSTILGKETAAGKAAAIAQTTIETYKSATSAFSSMASIPVVGPVLGAIAAAAAVASGLKTVKEITSVKTPSSGPIQGLATGGIVGDGFEIQRANGDDRLVTLQTDEAVLSRSSRAFMGDSMLAAAGVPMSGAASSTVGSSSPMMEEIALAVEQGAMRGSEQGSRSGSTEGIRRTAEDRLVQQSATF